MTVPGLDDAAGSSMEALLVTILALAGDELRSERARIRELLDERERARASAMRACIFAA